MKKRLLFLSIILFTSISLFAQNMGSINFINDLGEKGAVTFGDSVKFYIMILKRQSKGFNADIKTLRRMKILDKKDYNEKELLTRRMLSYMIAKHLKLKDSLFYLITESKRYAFKACVSEGLMDSDTSEWDIISGEELIEIMSQVWEKMEAKK